MYIQYLGWMHWECNQQCNSLNEYLARLFFHATELTPDLIANMPDELILDTQDGVVENMPYSVMKKVPVWRSYIIEVPYNNITLLVRFKDTFKNVLTYYINNEYDKVKIEQYMPRCHIKYEITFSDMVASGFRIRPYFNIKNACTLKGYHGDFAKTTRVAVSKEQYVQYNLINKGYYTSWSETGLQPVFVLNAMASANTVLYEKIPNVLMAYSAVNGETVRGIFPVDNFNVYGVHTFQKCRLLRGYCGIWLNLNDIISNPPCDITFDECDFTTKVITDKGVSYDYFMFDICLRNTFRVPKINHGVIPELNLTFDKCGTYNEILKMFGNIKYKHLDLKIMIKNSVMSAAEIAKLSTELPKQYPNFKVQLIHQ